MSFTRFDAKKSIVDFVKRYTALSMALDHASEGSEEVLFWFGKLAFYLMKAYAHDNKMVYLAESTRICQEGLAKAPYVNNEDKAAILETYANTLQAQAKRISSIEGLDLAIKLSLDAVATTRRPQSKVTYLNSLGN
jgi:hypothetical protein